MEQINAIELNDETLYPDSDVLKRMLGDSYGTYISLLKLFDANGMTYEWRYYKDGKAWLCKVQKKSKTIVWMSAWKGYMKATLYFPEKHEERIRKLDIEEGRRETMTKTKRIGKSIPCMFEIRGDDVLKDFEKVMRLKIELK